MNCQDIAAILDDRDIEGLSAAERRAVDLHLEDCHLCAKEWTVHERVVASPVPPAPGRLAERLHELARAADPTRRPRRAGGRPTIIAGLMLLGAAAAALVGVDFTGSDGASDPDPVTRAAVEAAPPHTDDAAAPAPVESAAARQPAAEPSASSASAQAEAEGGFDGAGYTVAVAPLIHATESTTVAPIAESIYRAMLDELEALPKLTLIELDAPAALAITGPAWHPRLVAAPDGPLPDAAALEEIASERDEAGNRVVFELEPVISFAPAGVAPAAGGEIVFEQAMGPVIGSRTVLQAEDAAGASIVDVVTRGGVTESVRIGLPTAEMAAGSGADYDYVLNVTSSARNDPATGAPRSFDFNVTGSAIGAAGGTVSFGISANLYESYDPSAMARQAVKQLQKLLFEPDESTIETLQSEVLDRAAPIAARLNALSELRMIAMRSGADGRVSELVPAVIDIAVNATDAGQRAWIWELIRGSGDRRLVAPLVDSLLYDVDEMVRLEAAKTLVTFPDDPTAIAALEQAGRFDPSNDVGMFASWATMTEDQHRDSVASALLDSTLPDAERIAPLAFADRYPYSVGGAELVRGIGADAASALVGIIERTASPELRADLMRHLAGADEAVVVEFLLDRLSVDASELVRAIAVQSLRARADDQNVRRALESASAGDASPVVRDLATLALDRGSN